MFIVIYGDIHTFDCAFKLFYDKFEFKQRHIENKQFIVYLVFRNWYMFSIYILGSNSKKSHIETKTFNDKRTDKRQSDYF